MTREERLAILGPDVIAKIHARVKEAPEPSDELVEELRRIMTNPAGEIPSPRPCHPCGLRHGHIPLSCAPGAP